MSWRSWKCRGRKAAGALRNETRRSELAFNVYIAETITQRTLGLMWVSDFNEGSALILAGGGGIHTFMVSQPLDLLFLDQHKRILRIIGSISPSRISPWVRGAKWIVELPAGSLEGADIKTGDQLRWE